MADFSTNTINYCRALTELFHEVIKVFIQFKNDKYMSHSELDLSISLVYKRIHDYYSDNFDVNISRIPLHVFSQFLRNDISLAYHFYNMSKDLNLPRLKDLDTVYHIESNRFNFVRVFSYIIYMGNDIMSINLPCYEVLKKLDGIDLPYKVVLDDLYDIQCMNSNNIFEIIKFVNSYRLRKLHSNLYYTLKQERKIYGN